MNMDLEDNNIKKDFKKLWELYCKIDESKSKIENINEKYSINLYKSYDSQKVNYEHYLKSENFKKIEDYCKKPTEPDKRCLESKYEEKKKILLYIPFRNYNKVGESKVRNYEGYDSRFWAEILPFLFGILIIGFIFFLIIISFVSMCRGPVQDVLSGYGKFFAVIVPVCIFGYFWIHINEYKVYKRTMIHINKNIEKRNKELKEKKEICNNKLKKYEEALIIYEKEKKEAELLVQEYNEKLIEDAKIKANENNAKIKKYLDENYDCVQQYYKLDEEFDLKLEQFNNKYNVGIYSSILYDLVEFFDQFGGVSQEAIILFNYILEYHDCDKHYFDAKDDVETYQRKVRNCNSRLRSMKDNSDYDYNHTMDLIYNLNIDLNEAENQLDDKKAALENAKIDLDYARHDLEHYFDSIKQLKQFSRFTFKDILDYDMGL